MGLPESKKDCPKCHGAGFFLKSEGKGYYRDGSFGHNEWEDCNCCYELALPKRESNAPVYYQATNNPRWQGSIHNVQGEKIEDSGGLFFVSELAVFKWAKSKGALKRLDNK
jgi:hypothetical protein